jgi:hypothetical protein
MNIISAEKRECPSWEMNPKYERYKNDYNPVHHNCGTCKDYGETGCKRHANIDVVVEE